MDEPTKLPLWEGRQVMLCLPHYKTSNPRTTFAMMAMFDRRRMAQSLDFGDAFVAHSRNKLAAGFLRSKMEWALFIDDDNVPPFGNAALYNSFTGFDLPEKFAGVHGIDRLMSHGKTLIGGLYRGRWPQSGPVFGEGPSFQRYLEDAPRDEIRQTQWVGFGFVLVHRTVFEDMEKEFPDLARDPDGSGGNWFTSSEHDLVKSVHVALAEADPAKMRQILELGLAKSARNSNLGVGEDVIFCRRAAQAGHPCHVDLGCIVAHLGEFPYGYPTKKRVL